MTERQIEAIVKLDVLIKPLADKVKELTELCKDTRRVADRDFLAVYSMELAEWKEFRAMLMQEFGGSGDMEIAKYKTMMNETGLPEVVMEQSYEWDERILDSPDKVFQLMKQVFQLHRETEEYLYEVCFNAKMKPIAVFEISHGTVNGSLISPREFFQKALLVGAVHVMAVHNHPSGDASPSREDDSVVERLKEAGKLMGVDLIDFVIVGESYYSYHQAMKL